MGCSPCLAGRLEGGFMETSPFDITSPKNPKIKHVVRLREKKRGMRRDFFDRRLQGASQVLRCALDNRDPVYLPGAFLRMQ